MGDKGRRAADGGLKVVHARCAGIDVGKSEHWVAVDGSMDARPVRSFGGFTEHLESLASWLSSLGVDVVSLEATGVYWIPLFEVLDRAGFDVRLVDARATMQVTGRKSDVLDCEWIRQLTSAGLLRAAFRPSDRVCELRSYVRQRSRLAADRARCVQHMQKALAEMNVQLDSVLSDLMGATGQRILRAIVGGERDGAALAKHRDRRVKADEATVAASLRGNWRAEHLFALEQALERFDLLTAQIARADGRIVETVESLAGESRRPDGGDGSADGEPEAPPAKPARTAADRRLQGALRAMLGVDLTAIPGIGVGTALAIASEIGPDLSRFPNQAHFCSWLKLAPGTRISGGRPLRGPPPKRTNRAGQALRMAAASVRGSDSYIGACHRSRLRRLDSARANKATAHQLARLVYAMLTQGEEYVAREVDDFEAERRDRQIRHLKRQARRFNLALVDRDAA
ncbi:MAG: IS110 family transposase [Gammaproteobacteria bacterium]|nr:IS110 family transposase [Gammaproteobacteria bacterium]